MSRKWYQMNEDPDPRACQNDGYIAMNGTGKSECKICGEVREGVELILGAIAINHVCEYCLNVLQYQLGKDEFKRPVYTGEEDKKEFDLEDALERAHALVCAAMDMARDGRYIDLAISCHVALEVCSQHSRQENDTTAPDLGVHLDEVAGHMKRVGMLGGTYYSIRALAGACLAQEE